MRYYVHWLITSVCSDVWNEQAFFYVHIIPILLLQVDGGINNRNASTGQRQLAAGVWIITAIHWQRLVVGKEPSNVRSISIYGTSKTMQVVTRLMDICNHSNKLLWRCVTAPPPHTERAVPTLAHLFGIENSLGVVSRCLKIYGARALGDRLLWRIEASCCSRVLWHKSFHQSGVANILKVCID